MKRYIKCYSSLFSDPELVEIDKQIKQYLGDNIIIAEPWAQGFVYLFKINSNVYRVFLLPEEIIFQCVAYAFNVGGGEHYDDAQDYGYDDGDKSNWFNLFQDWINECETDDPNFTQYITK